MAKRIGRPPKPEGERFIMRSFRLPPALWAEVEEHVPAGERTAAVADGLKRAVAKAKKAQRDVGT